MNKESLLCLNSFERKLDYYK